jgi:hypothetical protein
VVVVDSLVYIDTVRVTDTTEVTFLVPPVRDLTSEFSIPELDSIRAGSRLRDADSDGLAEGVAIGIEFLRETGDPFDPYSKVNEWSGVWWETHYSFYFDSTDNHRRPHSALGYRPPAPVVIKSKFAATS